MRQIKRDIDEKYRLSGWIISYMLCVPDSFSTTINIEKCREKNYEMQKDVRKKKLKHCSKMNEEK